MKKNFSNAAFTLIELIVSLALVSVIMLGIASVNMVLNNNSQDYGQKFLVKSETQNTLNNILNNASLAVGSATTINGFSDQGIVMGNDAVLGWADPNSFCIHQGPNNNIISSASDIWLCYTWYPAANGSYPSQIYDCTKTYNTTTVTRGAGSCVAASSNFQFLGSAFSISNPTPPVFSTTTGFSITIQNCLNDATPPGNCSATGTSSDPVNNPEVTVSGSVFPPQEGTG